MAAAINVMEPGSTGIGGDMFCLFYDAKTKKVHAMNGSGRSSNEVTLAKIRKELNIKDGENGQIPMTSVHAVTVPGAAAGWVDTVERFGSGKVTMEDVLAPAIELADNGYPISELSASFVSSFGDVHRLMADTKGSGRTANLRFDKHLPTLRKYSRKTHPRKMAAGHQKPERSCATQR